MEIDLQDANGLPPEDIPHCRDCGTICSAGGTLQWRAMRETHDILCSQCSRAIGTTYVPKAVAPASDGGGA